MAKQGGKADEPTGSPWSGCTVRSRRRRSRQGRQAGMLPASPARRAPGHASVRAVSYEVTLLRSATCPRRGAQRGIMSSH